MTTISWLQLQEMILDNLGGLNLEGEALEARWWEKVICPENTWKKMYFLTQGKPVQASDLQG